jgi:hypothetical protein
MFFMDTESIGYYGPTVLIQWAIDDGPIQVHNIFQRTAYETCRLIELMCEHTVVGFNLAHDNFHINRTYGVLKQLPPSKIPTALDIYDWENESICHDAYCVKPKNCIDYLVIGKKGLFQSVMKQKDIILKKVPKVLAPLILAELKLKVEIPDIYFKGNKTIRGANWKIIDLVDRADGSVDEITNPNEINEAMCKGTLNTNFVNIHLAFNPSAALKNIIEQITGNECITIDELPQFKKPEEYSYFPTLGTWLDVADEHIKGWSNDPQRIEYARNDIKYLRILRDYYINKGVFLTDDSGVDIIDSDSNLAWAVGAAFWRGFNVDLEKVKIQRERIDLELTEHRAISFNSPQWVLKYLHEASSPLERQGITDTKSDTLRNIADDKDFQEGNPELVKRCSLILRLRHIYKERDLYVKLLSAKRLYVQFKVIGTKSNRMSGGGESFTTSRGAINPQGIKKSPDVRECFLLAFADMYLSGGDFDGFEVSIAEAEYNDPELRKDLLRGKKIHGLFAEAMYGISYGDILLGKDLSEQDPLGYYNRGKRAFFGRLYGAQITKLMNVLWLTEEQILKGLDTFFTRYKGVKESQDSVYEDHQALVQEGGIGTKIIWKEPKQYVESFMGFKRYFNLEYSICKTLFNMAQNLSDTFSEQTLRSVRLVRRDRVQTAGGAAQSAIYAAAFNIQSQIMRSAVNHKIQSPGGQITKDLQFRIWDRFQPYGCGKWYVMLFNVHDELMVCHLEEHTDAIESLVNNFLEEMKSIVPLISMKWKKKLKNWGKK